MQTLGQTTSVCPACGALVAAKIVAQDDEVSFTKFCPAHGESRSVVRSGVADTLRTLRYVKPAWTPEAFGGDNSLPCPTGCGFCVRHEQHLCMPIIEITTRCDLACPVCINSSGAGEAAPAAPRAPWDLEPEALRRILEKILRAERQIDVLNFSGGEPLLHPRLFDLLDEAAARPEIVRLSLSTNGLRFLTRPDLLDGLRRRNVVVSLQFDGLDDIGYRVLRGRPLLDEKLRILNMMGQAGLTTTLTMTLGGGINDDQLPAMLDLLFSTPHVVSLMIQPVAFTGRAAALAGAIRRLTIPDVVGLLGRAGHPNVRDADFVPLPCSHPLCFSLAFYLMLGERRAVSINQLTDAATLLDSLSNRMFFGLAEGEQDRLKQLIYELWSGPAGAVPDAPAVLATLRGLLREISASACGCFDPRRAFTTMERKVKSVFIHAFQDAETFDLARVRRCCQAYPQEDGTLRPACVHNVLRRGDAAR